MHIWAVAFPPLRRDEASSSYKLWAGNSGCPTWSGGGTGCGRVQGHPAAKPMPPGRSHLTLSEAPSPGGTFLGARGASGRARDEQRPPGIPGDNSGMEEIVGVPGEILGIRVGISSFLPLQPPQAVCPEPTSYSVSQNLPQKRGQEREGGAHEAQLSHSGLTHGAEGPPAWPALVVRPDSWGLARSQHCPGLGWALLEAFPAFPEWPGREQGPASRAHGERCSAGWCSQHFKQISLRKGLDL